MNAYCLSGFVTICVQFHALRIQFEDILNGLNVISKDDIEYNKKVKTILCEAIRFRILTKE